MVGRDAGRWLPVEDGGEADGIDDGASVREGRQQPFEGVGLGDVGAAGAEGSGGEGVLVADLSGNWMTAAKV
ncbi:hypothetical protein [Nonomuraea sp. NPDC003804]|uniref:hypothetical protein n=1 Tax=Nonomuraea sp. NPDC003804 TaxID=3154547 RepID=UPI0033ACED99